LGFKVEKCFAKIQLAARLPEHFTMASILKYVPLLMGASAIRIGKRTGASAGIVDALYTWGAPQPTKDVLTNPKSSDGCWKGLRMVTVDTSGFIWDGDIVPTLLNGFSYEHPKMPVAKVDQKNKMHWKPCGWVGFSAEGVKVSLHMGDVYTPRLQAQNDDAWISKVTTLALEPSYMDDFGEIKQAIKSTGWKLVGSAAKEEKETHLFQDPGSLECIISFQGSARGADWWDNLKFASTDFCGMPSKVHLGFAKQVRFVTQSETYQANIRPKLGSCKKVSVAGHSLGGAISSLFAGCVNGQPAQGAKGWDDYEPMSWKVGSPKKLASL